MISSWSESGAFDGIAAVWLTLFVKGFLVGLAWFSFGWVDLVGLDLETTIRAVWGFERVDLVVDMVQTWGRSPHVIVFTKPTYHRRLISWHVTCSLRLARHEAPKFYLHRPLYYRKTPDKVTHWVNSMMLSAYKVSIIKWCARFYGATICTACDFQGLVYTRCNTP